jgi:pterin-4a-carbinolamine dehydratase
LAPEWTLVGDDDAAATGPTKLVREIEVQGGYMEGAKLMTTLAAVALNNDHYYKVGMERRLGKRKWTVVVKVECETAVLGGLSFQDFLVAGFVDTELERLAPS